jgi:hypothetical protein
VIFEEQLEEFLLVSPLNLVVILHYVRLASRSLWRGALGEERSRKSAKQSGKKYSFHRFSIRRNFEADEGNYTSDIAMTSSG